MSGLRRIARTLTGGRARWASAGVLVAAGAVIAGTVLPTSASPVLPRTTPAQLLAGIRGAKLPGTMTAVISETANLGLPALPQIGGVTPSSLSALSLLSGTHTVQIWYSGPRHLRIALPVSFGETDLRVNGNQVWLWNSHGQVATRYVFPALPPLSKLPRRALPRRALPAPMTPIQAARRLLALVGPTTKVAVAGTTTVAGRPAYQLQVAPRASGSLVSRIEIAVDATTHLPLQVQVFARGQSAAAFQIGFTSLSFARPDPSNFTFTPPPGAHVKTARLPAPPFPGLAGLGVAPARLAHPGFEPATKLPARPRPLPLARRDALTGVRVLGSGWLTVVAIPVAKAPSQISSLLPAILSTATLEQGAWGSGRLLRTALFNVLVTSKGQILVGAVTPRVLYADAAKVP